jgi:hypothetical protein
VTTDRPFTRNRGCTKPGTIHMRDRTVLTTLHQSQATFIGQPGMMVRHPSAGSTRIELPGRYPSLTRTACPSCYLKPTGLSSTSWPATTRWVTDLALGRWNRFAPTHGGQLVNIMRATVLTATHVAVLPSNRNVRHSQLLRVVTPCGRMRSQGCPAQRQCCRRHR